MAQKSQGASIKGLELALGWGEEEFEEARDAKGRGSVIQHRADGEHVYPRRRKQTQSEIGLVGWPENRQSMPSMMVNFCVILARLWCFIVWSNTILGVAVISI